MFNEKRKGFCAHILKAYGFTLDTLYPSQRGYRNLSFPLLTTSGEMLNIILYKDEPKIHQKIRCAHWMGGVLKEKGLPARRPYQTSNILTQEIFYFKYHGKFRYGALYTYLPGTTIPWESFTSKYQKLTGYALACVHASCPTEYPSFLEDAVVDCVSLLNLIEQYLNRADVQDALLSKLQIKLQIDFHYFQQCFLYLRTLKFYPLHLDFVRGNLLFSLDKDSQGLKHPKYPLLCLTGILDMEKCALGPRVLDIARTLAFLLSDGDQRDREKVRVNFLEKGYLRKQNFSLPNRDTLECLLHYFWLADFYKFLKYNPFEDLKSNLHFRATCVLLKEKNNIKTAGF